MFVHDFIYTLLTLPFLLSPDLTNATPTATTKSLLLASNTTTTVNAVLPFCFDETSHPNLGTTNSHDCRETLRMIYRDPNRDRVFRFSKNPRSSIDVVKIPHGWQHGECVIYVSCSNPRDAAYFTFGDVAREAVTIVRDCVDKQDIKYGGIQEIGTVSSFYVSVGRPAVPSGVMGRLSAPPAEATLVGNSSLLQAALGDFHEVNSGFIAAS